MISDVPQLPPASVPPVSFPEAGWPSESAGRCLPPPRSEAGAIAAKERGEAAGWAPHEFLSIAAHELRSPMTPILGWTSFLRTCSVTQAERNNALEAIDRSMQALAQTIETLLDASWAANGKLRLASRRTALEPVVQAAAEAVGTAVKAKGLRLRVLNEAEKDAAVWGDPERLQQVFWHLLSNAVKFTPGGGVVDVRIRRAGPSAEVAVSDTGVGIAAEFAPALFGWFRQGEDSVTRCYGGLGVGLALSRRIVELHGGAVEARSGGPGKGATFIVRLPRLVEQPPPGLL